MAKVSMINRENKRTELVAKYAEKREELKKIISSEDATMEEKEAAMFALQKLPRDSSPIRRQRRCSITGRPHGVYRKFGLGRNKLREITMRGDIPGLRKSSW
ncbi:30S ribosomal protein S14 [Ignatzschineria sp. RMDPL8A]|uniref:30S ribosomal protein S14 n=1 Tax=Ignatzschineria sp. RMDPL8A TaxID=2999236 RepID=UPI00169A7235|nr:30S ribosomal protein S14 [Ignatzschineria sp. RMDPL8A]MDG9729503.1 30S ribosomal protein S14 [Ignatzschineria sp. RMDPL8A]NLD07977.1 30S ribosomal protein S14 [Xanthomonadaceae bacterium]